MSEFELSKDRVELVEKVVDSEGFAQVLDVYGVRSFGTRNIARLATLTTIDLQTPMTTTDENLEVPIWPLLRVNGDLKDRELRLARFFEGTTDTVHFKLKPDQISLLDDSVLIQLGERHELETTIIDPTIITLKGFQMLQKLSYVGSGQVSPAGAYWRVALLTARHSNFNTKEHVTGIVSLSRKGNVYLEQFAKNIRDLAPFGGPPKKVRNRLKPRR